MIYYKELAHDNYGPTICYLMGGVLGKLVSGTHFRPSPKA